MVVQPHVSQAMYERIEAGGGSAGATNAYRLMLLETVLNASRSAARGSRPHDAMRCRPAICSLPGRALRGRAWAVAGRGAVPREVTLAGCAAAGAGGTAVPDVAICRTT